MNPPSSFVSIVLAYFLGASAGVGMWRAGAPLLVAIWASIAIGAVLSIYAWVRTFDATPGVRLDEELARAARQARGDYRSQR